MVLAYYELIGQTEKANKLRELLAAHQVLAGPMNTAFGARMPVIFIATNRKPEDLSRTLVNTDFSQDELATFLLHESYLEEHKINEQAEIPFRAWKAKISAQNSGQQEADMINGANWGFYVFEIPESQVGGIADVAEGLPEAILKAETKDGTPNSLYRVTPYYQGMKRMTDAIPVEELETVVKVLIPYGDEIEEVEVKKNENPSGIVDYLLVGDAFNNP